MSFVARLRAASRPDHDRVDALFGGYRLDDPGDYARFLTAQARALGGAEAALAVAPDLPPWRPRLGALAADLAALDHEMPLPLPFAAPGASAWGLLYVAEGSRLGGAMLARAVPEDWPSAYLSARHEHGEWRRTLDALEARAGDPAWEADALAGAAAGFRLWEKAGRDAAATLP